MTTARRKLGLYLFVCCIATLLSSCGGGGTSSPPPPPPPAGTFSLSANQVSFKAAGPYAQSPATQVITGSVTGVTSGTVYVKVVANNAVANSQNGLFTVTDLTITGDSGQANVIPAIPSSIGAGSFQGSITVTACLNDASCQTGQLAGSPQTISVAYDVASGVDGGTVTPRVVAANAAGQVIVRGGGFTGATNVSFGSVSATSMTVVSDSEIDASYPALPAGSYPVSINSGSISDSATLVAVSPPDFSATFIPYPSLAGLADPLAPVAFEYDAQRTALFVVLPGLTANNELQGFVFDGTTWTSPTEVTLNNLTQIHLSPDGTHILALVQDIQDTSMVELDPVTLAQTNITTLPSSPFSCGFALANDGNAIVSITNGNAPTAVVFGTFSRVFTPMSVGGDCGPTASGNGAIVAMTNGNFIASSEMVIQPGASGTSGDLAGDEFVNGDVVENQTGQVLGYLSTSFTVINPAGTRAYGYTPDPVACAPTLTTYDLTATPSGSPSPEFPVLGTPITLQTSCLHGADEGYGYLLAITPDGATVFIARPDGVVVQPVSP
jgi:hypothetical protein